MRIATLAAVLLMATLSQAETITCHFTEPQMTTVYNDSTKQLVVNTINRNAALTIDAADVAVADGVRVVVDSENDVLLTLSYDGNGNNGASDEMYPISAVVDLKDVSPLEAYYGNRNVGGCETSK